MLCVLHLRCGVQCGCGLAAHGLGWHYERPSAGPWRQVDPGRLRSLAPVKEPGEKHRKNRMIRAWRDDTSRQIMTGREERVEGDKFPHATKSCDQRAVSSINIDDGLKESVDQRNCPKWGTYGLWVSAFCLDFWICVNPWRELSNNKSIPIWKKDKGLTMFLLVLIRLTDRVLSQCWLENAAVTHK